VVGWGLELQLEGDDLTVLAAALPTHAIGIDVLVINHLKDGHLLMPVDGALLRRDADGLRWWAIILPAAFRRAVDVDDLTLDFAGAGAADLDRRREGTPDVAGVADVRAPEHILSTTGGLRLRILHNLER